MFNSMRGPRHYLAAMQSHFPVALLCSFAPAVQTVLVGLTCMLCRE